MRLLEQPNDIYLSLLQVINEYLLLEAASHKVFTVEEVNRCTTLQGVVTTEK